MIIKLLKATIEKKEMGTNELQLLFSFNDELTPIAVESTSAAYSEALDMLSKVNGSTNIEEFSWDLAHVVIPGRKLMTLISEEKVLNENLKIVGGKVIYQDTVMDDTLLTYIMTLLDSNDTPKDKKTWNALMNFIENLHQNVSPFVREQLFGWMRYEIEDGNAFAITDDGCFIGYRGVTGTIDRPVSINKGTAFVDGVKHVGAIPNPIGSIVSMPRHQVEDNPAVGCAPGLHVGTWDYASGWTDNGLVLTVKVNPRNVVSVPTECDSQKIRVSEYQVLEVAYDPLANLLYDGYSEPETFDQDVLEKLDEALETTESGDYVGGSITVHYDGKSFTGSVIDYEWDRIVLRDDYEYKTILAHRVEDIEFYNDEEDEDDVLYEVSEDEDIEYEEFFDKELDIIHEAFEAFLTGDKSKPILVVYEGKVFSGYVVDYEEDRVVMKNDEGIYKTILSRRVDEIGFAVDFNDTEENDELFGHKDIEYEGYIENELIEFTIKELEKSIRDCNLLEVMIDTGLKVIGIPVAIKEVNMAPVLYIGDQALKVEEIVSIKILSYLH